MKGAGWLGGLSSRKVRSVQNRNGEQTNEDAVLVCISKKEKRWTKRRRNCHVHVAKDTYIPTHMYP